MTSARLGELKMLQRLVVVLCLVLQSSGSARAWDSEELGTYFRLNMVLDPVFADPDPGSGAFFLPLDPGSGMGKK